MVKEIFWCIYLKKYIFFLNNKKISKLKKIEMIFKKLFCFLIFWNNFLGWERDKNFENNIKQEITNTKKIALLNIIYIFFATNDELVVIVVVVVSTCRAVGWYSFLLLCLAAMRFLRYVYVCVCFCARVPATHSVPPLQTPATHKRDGIPQTLSLFLLLLLLLLRRRSSRRRNHTRRSNHFPFTLASTTSLSPHSPSLFLSRTHHSGIRLRATVWPQKKLSNPKFDPCRDRLPPTNSTPT